MIQISHWNRHTKGGAELEARWLADLDEYENKYPQEAAEFKNLISGELPQGWEKALPVSRGLDYMVCSHGSIFCI